MLHEQRLYAAHEVCVEGKMMKSNVLARNKRDAEEEVCAEKVLLLSPCVALGEKEGNETTAVYFLEWEPSLDAVDDALGCLCMRWAAARS